jgi:aliphatic nitrilase
MITEGGGWSAIIGPNGQIIEGPHTGATEKILYADVDLSDIALAKMACDPIGHYSRPDIFHLEIDKRKQTLVTEIHDVYVAPVSEHEAAQEK